MMIDKVMIQLKARWVGQGGSPHDDQKSDDSIRCIFFSKRLWREGTRGTCDASYKSHKSPRKSHKSQKAEKPPTLKNKN